MLRPEGTLILFMPDPWDKRVAALRYLSSVATGEAGFHGQSDW
jgi:hypothetical protein